MQPADSSGASLLASGRPDCAVHGGYCSMRYNPQSSRQASRVGEASAIIAFTLQDTPETFHRPVVDAFADPGHTLLHLRRLQLVVENAVGIR